jgi:hypothetical protein
MWLNDKVPGNMESHKWSQVLSSNSAESAVIVLPTDSNQITFQNSESNQEQSYNTQHDEYMESREH